MFDLYLFKIKEILEGSKKERWDNLKTLQVEAKQGLPCLIRRQILEEISAAFTTVINERESNAQKLEKLILTIDCPESLTLAQQLLDELDIFPSDLSKLSRDYKNLEAAAEQKKLDEIVLGTKFSQLAIPDISSAHVDTVHVP